jgi:Ser/Thr protein kinase RdoA (MazF antagonist)
MNLSPQEARAVHALGDLFGLSRPDQQVLHRGQGIVLEASRQGEPVILKIMAAAKGATDDLQARLDWILYLHTNGLRVPELIESTNGEWIRQVQIDGTTYTAYAYVRIPLTDESRIDWHDDALPPKLGQVMGRMHRLSGLYQPEPGMPRMQQWDEVDWLVAPANVLHPSQAAIVDSVLRLRDAISRFPRTAGNYALIHDDLHTGNVFRVGGELAVIDFDCCHYGWFAADLSSALLFRTWIGPDKERPEVKQQAVRFLRGVIQGYQMENDLPLDWAYMLPTLLKLREISLFQSDYRGIDVAGGQGDELFRYLFDSISNDKPFLDIDFGLV